MIKLAWLHRLIDVVINSAIVIYLLLMTLVASSAAYEINILKSIVNEIRDIQNKQQLTGCEIESDH